MGCLSNRVLGRTYYGTWAWVGRSGGECRTVAIHCVLNAVREQGRVYGYFHLIYRKSRLKGGYSFCGRHGDLLSVLRLNSVALF